MRPRVTLTVIVLLASLSASARNLYIPVAGVTRGANNTSFRTDLRLFNPSFTKDLGVTLHYLPLGHDGSNIPGRVVNVPHRQMVVLNDVVGGFFQIVGPSIGAIRIDSNEDLDYAIVASSRTYTDSSGSAGTLSQFIPALEASNASKDSIVLQVSQSVDLSTGYRTNAGVMNPGRDAATVTFSVYSADGTLLSDGATITIPPMSMFLLPLNVLIGSDRPLEQGFIRFSSTAPLFTFASVVDNRSNDAFFVTGQMDDATVLPLP